MPVSKAVVCGIDVYAAPNDLPSCVHDAEAVAGVLRERYGCGDVHLVVDRDATMTTLERELQWLVRDAASSDWLFFYFSGHGYTGMSDGVMEEFLVLLDESGDAVMWKDDRLIAITRGIPPGKMTMVLDCCFSGGMDQ